MMAGAHSHAVRVESLGYRPKGKAGRHIVALSYIPNGQSTRHLQVSYFATRKAADSAAARMRAVFGVKA